jgi:hypothetical protein
MQGIMTDHLPIITELDLNMGPDTGKPTHNFREVNWEEFHIELEMQLANLPPPQKIRTQREMNTSCEKLMLAIQETIETQVPVTEITLKSKRWWTKELTQLCKETNKLGRLSYKRRNDREHRVHAEHTEAAKRYNRTLKNTKQQHWRDWIEKAEDPDIWTVHRLISAPATDGGKARIPALKYKVGDVEKIATTNGKKGAALATGFFPPKPQSNGDFCYDP